VIVVDTSALVAVILGEPDAERFRDALSGDAVAVSAVSVTEALMVLESRAGLDATRDLEHLLQQCEATIVAYDAHHTAAAHAAWQRFGKGRHPASLNFGDCMAYATAKLSGAPLLYRGNDFAQTDVAAAR
jgi:ribonuclease VapC